MMLLVRLCSDECLQLIFQIFRLLPRQPRDGVIAMEAAPRNAVTVFAISDFSLQFARRNGCLVGMLGGRRPGENKANATACNSAAAPTAGTRRYRSRRRRVMR
jgi:hypothetical protein